MAGRWPAHRFCRASAFRPAGARSGRRRQRAPGGCRCTPRIRGGSPLRLAGRRRRRQGTRLDGCRLFAFRLRCRSGSRPHRRGRRLRHRLCHPGRRLASAGLCRHRLLQSPLRSTRRLCRTFLGCRSPIFCRRLAGPGGCCRYALGGLAAFRCRRSRLCLAAAAARLLVRDAFRLAGHGISFTSLVQVG